MKRHKSTIFSKISIFLLGTTTLFSSASANDNFIRIEKGEIVENGFTNTLHPLTRAEGSSTSNDNVFTGSISIVDALNPDSPFSQWVDDLLNPDSDPYKAAVVDALKCLLLILLAALAPFGIDSFTILILGFTPGSVVISYEVAIPSDHYAIHGAPLAIDIADQIFDVIESNEVPDPNTGEIWYLDKTETVFNEDVTSCPVCWRIVEGNCVPDPAFFTLTCNSDGMVLEADHCIMGNTDLNSISLKGGCDADSGHISDNGEGFVVSTGLDECSSVMTFDDDYVKFSNTLSGTYDNGIISTFDRYRVHFQCSYDTTYDDIGGATNVTSSINSGHTNDAIGELSFKLNTFEDDTFSTPDADGHAIVGTTLYYGVELENPITGVEFTVTDCQVYSDINFQDENTLQYNIFTNKCENSRVAFKVWEGTGHDLTKFSYTVFEFKNMEGFNTLYLNCRVVVCDASDVASLCNAEADCGSRRRRKRSVLEQGAQYFHVSKLLEAR